MACFLVRRCWCRDVCRRQATGTLHVLQAKKAGTKTMGKTDDPPPESREELKTLKRESQGVSDDPPDDPQGRSERVR